MPQAKWPSTTLTDPAFTADNINKALLDLLKKINDTYTLAQSIKVPTVPTFKFGRTVLTGLAGASAVSLSTGVAANVLSFSLDPGTWDVSGVAALNLVAGTSILSAIRLGISTVSADFSGNTGEMPSVTGDVSFRPFTLGAAAQAESILTAAIPSYRIIVAATTTFWLVVQASFSAGTASAYGWVQAVQVTKGVLS